MNRPRRQPDAARPRAAASTGGLDPSTGPVPAPRGTRSWARRHTFALVALVAASMVLCVLGWRAFWFLTDDSFIAFRYIAHRHLGHGYTWNPPPFLPVEGYTSLLWILLLDGLWTLFGVSPGDAANPVALAFSLLTLAASSGLAWVILSTRRPWSRLALLALVLLYVVTNRTFLMWTSSGLETALFDFLVVGWVLCQCQLRSESHRWPVAASTFAALLALTRPDGLLYAATTAGCLALLAYRRSRLRWLPHHLSPLLMVATHLLWRFLEYGAWLPNTYYAKVMAPWPEAGWRYLASFSLEYGLWLWLLVVLPGAATALARAARNRPPVESWLGPSAATLAILLHVGYYLAIVGGDHFEYRILAHVVPLLPISAAWSLQVLRIRTGWAVAALAALLAVGAVLPWTHWRLSRERTTRAETHRMHVPLAGAMPAPLRAYTQAFDQLQSWLIAHYVGLRHQEHKVYAEEQMRSLESLVPRLGFLDEELNPVVVARNVGVLGWLLEGVPIIDTAGLNDYFVARIPVPPSPSRLMAHERVAPDYYIESFRPNLVIGRPGVVRRRPDPLTDREIVDLERAYREMLPLLRETASPER
ncbi:MAG TPA: hypothetical protein VMV46_12920 [Thermoanaerobaculia bacterium]|nr:hypothetical protein [Thermoanaerobaculia bacterium]